MSNKLTEIDPMEKFIKDDADYMDAIKYFGSKLHGNEPICCDDVKNHQKIFLITSAYKRCRVCKTDLGDMDL